jgi:hypothetical protein
MKMALITHKATTAPTMSSHLGLLFGFSTGAGVSCGPLAVSNCAPQLLQNFAFWGFSA